MIQFCECGKWIEDPEEIMCPYCLGKKNSEDMLDSLIKEDQEERS